MFNVQSKELFVRKDLSKVQDVPALALFFAGPVSLHRTARSIPICVVQSEGGSSDNHVKFMIFINGDKVLLPTESHPVPAWLVPIVGADAKGSKDSKDSAGQTRDR